MKSGRRTGRRQKSDCSFRRKSRKNRRIFVAGLRYGTYDFADKKSKKYTEKVSEKSRNSCKRTDCISGKLDKKLYENKERKRAEKGSLFFIRDICKDSQKKHILI